MEYYWLELSCRIINLHQCIQFWEEEHAAMHSLHCGKGG